MCIRDRRDAAFPLVNEIVPTSDPDEAFAGANWCLLVGSVPPVSYTHLDVYKRQEGNRWPASGPHNMPEYSSEYDHTVPGILQGQACP